VEEATELELGMRGLTSYAETVSVYGTEAVFTDGDDTPWSKAFLASAYASRGLKMRYTSGTGSEALMGYSESKSMLYLESRCIFHHQRRGRSGTAKRRGQLYRHDRRCAVGHPRGAGGKPDRLNARP
jgi:glycerol dehydratase large subunit